MSTGTRHALSVAILLVAGPRAEAQSVDLLITGGTVVTMNGDWDVYEDGAIAIADGRIVEVGTASELREKGYRPVEEIDARGKVTLPGLVNTHTHVPMPAAGPSVASGLEPDSVRVAGTAATGYARRPRQPILRHPFSAPRRIAMSLRSWATPALALSFTVLTNHIQ